MSDPLDIWRTTFEDIVPEDGQLQIWLGPEVLQVEATREEIEQQARELAESQDR